MYRIVVIMTAPYKCCIDLDLQEEYEDFDEAVKKLNERVLYYLYSDIGARTSLYIELWDGEDKPCLSRYVATIKFEEGYSEKFEQIMKPLPNKVLRYLKT